MGRERKHRWGTSSLLNKEGHHSVAAVATTFEIGTWGDGSVDCDMTISDCSDTVNLTFSYNSDDEYENSMHKIDLLIRQMQRVKHQLKKYPMKEVTRIANEATAAREKKES
jgi:hypothetical protein